VSAPTDPFADHSRSGDDVAEAIEVAERGSSVQEIHDRPEDAKPGAAPVEQTDADPEMTEGQVVLGDEGGGKDAGPSGSPGPTGGSSGVAQSVVGARASDEIAGG